MMRSLVLAFACLACFTTLGCGGGETENEVMPEPTLEEEQQQMDFEMQQEAEMEDPANR